MKKKTDISISKFPISSWLVTICIFSGTLYVVDYRRGALKTPFISFSASVAAIAVSPQWFIFFPLFVLVNLARGLLTFKVF